MKKKLDETSIANELRGASLFFNKSADVEDEQDVPEIQSEAKPRRRTTTPKQIATPTTVNEIVTEAPIGITAQAPLTEPAPTDALPETIAAVSPTLSQAELVETIRKNVKRLGKESTVYRFTPEEKSALADIVYTYKRNGVRTSENEVIRIAMNWLLENYQTDGKNSMLARVLDKLNA